MLSPSAMTDRLGRAFTPAQSAVLTEVIWQSYNDLVRASDLTELKEVVRELAEAQRELAEDQKQTRAELRALAEAQRSTDVKMGALAEAQRSTDLKMGALAEAQRSTDLKMAALAEAQRSTDVKMGALAEAQRSTDLKMAALADAQRSTDVKMGELAEAMKETRREFGGVTVSVAYALENEAYRLAPRVLADRHGVTLDEKLVRTTIQGEEVNLLGRGRREGRAVWVVGEAKLRLDVGRGQKGARDVFTRLETKVAAVRREKGDVEVVRVLVTHFATPEFLALAEDRNTLVIQSFEW